MPSSSSQSRLFRATLMCFALLLAHAALTGAQSKGVQKDFVNFQGHERIVYVFIPDSSPTAVPAPLIVLLHGSGEEGISLADPWRSLAAKEGIILVAPNSANRRTWDPHDDHPDFIRELIDHVEARHLIDRRRLYLFGHSGGGMYALTLSLLESQYFAATAVHAGVLRQVTAQTLESAKRKIPLALWSGTQDRMISLSAVEESQHVLEEHGFPVELHPMPGRDHNYYVHSSEVNEAAWGFLRGHELEESPKFQSYKP